MEGVIGSRFSLLVEVVGTVGMLVEAVNTEVFSLLVETVDTVGVFSLLVEAVGTVGMLSLLVDAVDTVVVFSLLVDPVGPVELETVQLMLLLLAVEAVDTVVSAIGVSIQTPVGKANNIPSGDQSNRRKYLKK